MNKIFNSSTHFTFREYQNPLTRQELLFLTVLMCVKIFVAWLLIKSGFIALSADDFARQLISNGWSQHSEFFRSGWPPLQFWIVGTMIKMYPDIRMANLLVNGVFSILTMVYLYYLVRLFFEKRIALVTIAIMALFPWQLKLSISGLCEPISHFFMIASLFYLFRWEATEKKYSALLCGLSLLFANMLRIDAWVFYISVNIYILILLLFLSKNRSKDILFFTFVIPSIFIITWIMLGKVQLNYDTLRDDYAKAATQLANTYISTLRYPGYLFLVSPLISMSGTIGLIVFLRKDFERAFHYLFIPLLYLLGLIGISVLTGSDSLAAPLRMVVPFIYLLTPVSLFLLLKSEGSRFIKFGYAFISLIFVWNVYFTFHFNRNDFTDIAEVSEILKSAWSEGLIHENDKVIFERNILHTSYYYDALALKVLSNHPDNVFIYEKSTPQDSFDQIARDVRGNDVAAFVASSQVAKKELSKFCPVVYNAGVYKIFWNIKDVTKVKNLSIFESRQPKCVLNKVFGQGIELVGYSIEHGDFPSGFTTYWKFNNLRRMPVKIQYGLIQREINVEPIILGSHYLENYEDRSISKDGQNIIDWQALILPEKQLPGEYTLAIRLAQKGGAGEGAFNFSDWYVLTKVTLITNKRDILSHLLKGTPDIHALGLKVIMSLF